MSSDFQEKARRLRNAVEPVAAGVYFAAEAHAAYAALGFDGSPAAQDGVARPDLKAYFTSRGACMGQVAGEVVAAAFGCFNPKVVVPSVEAGWQVTSRDAILEARERAATAMLQRVLGDQPEGLDRVTELLRRAAAAARWEARPIFGGLRSLGFPATPLGAMWRAADLVREHRGDSHVISWAVGGADAVEILLLTEQWWGLPARVYTPSRGWTAADMDAGFDRLKRRGLVTTGEQLTDAGRAFREEVEVRTDELERPLLDALGDDLDELLKHLDAWSEAIIASGSYPKRIAGIYNIGGGPHFGSGLTIDTAAELHENRA
jgi:Helix-turn-helix family